MSFKQAFKQKLIYVFEMGYETHKGCLKVGEATFPSNFFDLKPNSSTLNKFAKKRINQYTQTAGVSYNLVHTEVATYQKNNKLYSFSDHDVRKVLYRSGIEKKLFDLENKANEWVICSLDTVKKAILAVKNNIDSLQQNQIGEKNENIIFRPEQKEAIEKTLRQFKKGKSMLWNAKMRFGKTLSALQLTKKLNVKKTLILTHRPVVDKGWYEDFGKIFSEKESNFKYGSKNKGSSFEYLNNKSRVENFNYVYFASIQDLRGSKLVGGNFKKNNDIFNNDWNLLIVDEAHEGTQTKLGKNVIDELINPDTKVLNLSGTPFNLFDNYSENEIFTWDYVMEQRAKRDWDILNFGDPNPYSSLPKMNIFTYNLGEVLKDYRDEYLAFNFKEFFKTKQDGKFVHEEDVKRFLDMLCVKKSNSNYPFSTDEFRENFRHTLWMLPGVKEARALSLILKSHNVFSQFKIVNVAGDGDEEEEKDEALKKVEKAITNKPNLTFTITLSCGKLTTGVSVKAWTGVFMMSGSYNTSASSYMQTIFRVQTPAIINGKIKEECFVFDFAPDRTLKVIAETAKLSSGNKNNKEVKTIIGEFLNFCPIISIYGSNMESFNVTKMLEQLNKAYIDRVVNNGFEDGKLYNDQELMKMNIDNLKEFNELRKIIGSTKSSKKTNEIEINKQGFDEEQLEKIKKAKGKKKKELTDEEKKLLQELKEKKKNRDSAISILRGISIRMPLMIYGAEINDENNELTINNFTSLIDDRSWQEFMPKDVTKEIFGKFKKYYDEDVFTAAGKRIRALTRSADKHSIEERIDIITTLFSKFRNPDKETVLTPWRVVNMHMASSFGGYVFFDNNYENKLNQTRYVEKKHITKNIFDESSIILDINSKSGLYHLFVCYNIYRKILKKKFTNVENIQISNEEQNNIWDEVIKKNIFMICKSQMAKRISKRTLVGYRDVKINSRFFEDFTNQIISKRSKLVEQIRNLSTYRKNKNNIKMKFNAVIGNPPYQEMGGSGGNNDAPIFQNFCQISGEISENYVSLIIPARWFAAGRENLLGEFRKTMLNSGKIQEMHVFTDSRKLFSNVEIKGGICFYLENNNYNGKCNYNLTKDGETEVSIRDLGKFDILIRDIKLSGIVEKVNNKINRMNYLTVDKIISSDTPFGIPSNPKTSKKNPFKVYPFKKNSGYVELHHIENGERKTEFVKISDINKNQKDIDKNKVFLMGSSGSGDDMKVIGKPELAKKNSVCSQSYLYSAFDSSSEAKNFIKYCKTKFFRILVSSVKITQSAPKRVYRFVPCLDLSNNSDINWNMEINEIDNILYKKFDLSESEKKYIEKRIVLL